MDEFSYRRDFRFISWKATLVTALYRSVAAGLVLGVLMLLFGDTRTNTWVPYAMPLLGPVFYFALFLPVGLAANSLARMGVPYIGLVNVVCSLFIVPGDPLLFLFHQLTDKKYVPIERLNFINFSIIIFVIDEEKRAQAMAA